jgi:predicted Rdx family selenoprotein
MWRIIVRFRTNLLPTAALAAATAIALVAGCSREPEKGAPPAESSARRPWTTYRFDEVLDFEIDPAHQCVWLVHKGALARLDLKTGASAIVADGQKEGGMGAWNIAVDGDRVWVGGHKAHGGGLWVYDIPTGKAVVYRVANTAAGGTKGLQSDWVAQCLAEKGVVWLYSDNGLDCWGLTRFAPAEQDFAKRWATYRAGPPQAPNALMSDCISAMLRDGKRYLLSADGEGFEEFNPAGPTFTRIELLPSWPKTVTAVTPRGDKVAIGFGGNRLAQLLAVEDQKVWFRAGVQTTASWAKGVALVCLDRADHSYLVITPGLTESRPGCKDGMWAVPGSICLDGDDVWMAAGDALTGICLDRYGRTSRDFTHYHPRSAGVPDFGDIWRLDATKDSIWVGARRGLFRFVKSREYPKAVGGFVTQAGKEVAIGREIAVAFDIAMNVVTIDTRSVELWVNGSLYSGDVSYDPNRNAAVLAITESVPAGAQCELVLKSLIQAANGNPLRWTRIAFTTPAAPGR